jgi:hypothetical protein
MNAGAEEMSIIARGEVGIDEQTILLTTIQFINNALESASFISSRFRHSTALVIISLPLDK